MTPLTPSVRKANRRAAAVVGGVVLLAFTASIILIAVFDYGPPQGEFAGVETKVILTRNYFVDEALPRSTEDAAHFQATYDAAQPSLQPILAATATAIHNDVSASLIPRSTEEAAEFPATLQAVSTIIREGLEAAATAAAGE